MCGCKNGIAGMRRSKMSKQNLTSMILTGAKIGGGLLVGQIIVNKVQFLSQNPGLKVAGQVLGGLATMKLLPNKTGSELGAGMIAGAAIDAVKMIMPSVAQQAGIAGFTDYSASTRVPGIAGAGDYSVPMVALG